VVIARIYGKGRGWAFTQIDFADVSDRRSIDVALHRLLKEGRIRRIGRGVYDYPGYSEFLKQTLSPDYDQAAQAIARKHGWRIQVSGSTALNLIGLSTQVPGRFTYLSDGPTKELTVYDHLVEFRHTALKEAGFKHPESSMIVQALRSLGPDRMTPDVLDAVRKWLDPALCQSILKDTRTVTGWINQAIHDICGERG
jgi:hypothetical protein